jgi:hypothetical protein
VPRFLGPNARSRDFFLVLMITLAFRNPFFLDYNNDIDFSNLKTYAFSKQGVDKVKINDIDKKRILKAIDVELYNKGFRKSSIDPEGEFKYISHPQMLFS